MRRAGRELRGQLRAAGPGQVPGRAWTARRGREAVTAHASEVDRLGYARLIAEYRSMLAELRLRRGDAEAARADAKAVGAVSEEVKIGRRCGGARVGK